MDRPPKEHIKQLLLQIPPGKVVSYGQIGSLAGISGWQAGRLLTGFTPVEQQEYPWWRVVAKDGSLPSHRLGMRGQTQKLKLLAEGVTFIKDQVDMSSCMYVFSIQDPDNLSLC